MPQTMPTGSEAAAAAAKAQRAAGSMAGSLGGAAGGFFGGAGSSPGPIDGTAGPSGAAAGSAGPAPSMPNLLGNKGSPGPALPLPAKDQGLSLPHTMQQAVGAAMGGPQITGDPGFKGHTFEHITVLLSLGGFLLSIMAATIAILHQGDVNSCLAGLAGGAGPLQGLMGSLVVHYCIIILVNAASVTAIWLSFFHCQCLDSRLTQNFTSARSLFFLMCLAFLTFTFQIVRLGYAVTMHGILAFLGYICNMGPGVVYLGQQLVYAMGNATITSESGTFTPRNMDMSYGHHTATTSFFSMDAMVTRLDILRYCKDSDGGRDAAASMVMTGCLLALVSQALMTAALCAEEARVGVHDLHEEHSLSDLSKTFQTQALSSMGKMPMLAQQAGHDAWRTGQDAWRNSQGLRNSLMSTFNNFAGNPSRAGYVAGTQQPSNAAGTSSFGAVPNSQAAYGTANDAFNQAAAAGASAAAAAQAGFANAFGASGGAGTATSATSHIGHGARRLANDASNAMASGMGGQQS